MLASGTRILVWVYISFRHFIVKWQDCKNFTKLISSWTSFLGLQILIQKQYPRWKVLYKKLFLEISQNSQENICARVSFLIKLQLLDLLIVLLNSITHAVLYWQELIPFYQKISGKKFKVCFTRSFSPSLVAQTRPNSHNLEILLAFRQSLVAQNRGASVRLHHWRNLMAAYVFMYHFLLIFATQLIETRFFLFWDMFYYSFWRW